MPPIWTINMSTIFCLALSQSDHSKASAFLLLPPGLAEPRMYRETILKVFDASFLLFRQLVLFY